MRTNVSIGENIFDMFSPIEWWDKNEIFQIEEDLFTVYFVTLLLFECLLTSARKLTCKANGMMRQSKTKSGSWR